MKKFTKRFCSLVMAGTLALGFAACETTPTEVTRYKVEFKDYDGSAIGAEQSVAEGGFAFAPLINPSRAGWKFVGWDKEFDEVTEDMVITARYEAIEYEVKFFGDDGAQLGETQKVTYENDASAPTAPTVEGKTFVGWKGDYTGVTRDVNVYAVYETTPKTEMHAVTFVGPNGEFLEMQSVADGLTATAPTVDTYRKNYYFCGWDKPITNIQADTVVRAVFDTAEDIDGLKLYKTAGEEFKILNLSDIQIINMESSAASGLTDSSYAVYHDMDTAVFDTVRYLVEESNPDYIVLTGDNIYSKFEFEDLRTWKALFDVVDGYKIPWSMNFGNHDGSIPNETAANNVTLERIVALADGYKYFLYESNADILGEGEEGTYAVNIVEKGSEKLVQKIFYMYAHYNEGWYTDEQLAWYEEGAKALVTDEGVVPSLLYTHYPLPEMERSAYAYDELHTPNGTTFTGITLPETETLAFGEMNSVGFMSEYGLFRLIKKYGSTQNVFTGHEHSNNISTVYEGVRLTYGLKTGYYDQKEAKRYLNGGTVFSIGDDNRDYSMYHIFHKGEKDGVEQGVYNQAFTFEANVDTRTYMQFSMSSTSTANFSGSKKITLAAGQSASIEVDIAEAPSSSSSIQTGFFVSKNAISSNYPYTSNGAAYLYFMADGPHSVNGDPFNLVEDVQDVVPDAYSRGSTQSNMLASCHPKNVFATGNSVKLTVNADGTYTMSVKKVTEADTAYQVFANGSITCFDIANGFYLAFASNREMKLFGAEITGNDYITQYNTVGMSFIPEGATPMTIANAGVDTQTYHYVYGKEGITLGSADDVLSVEFEMVSAPAGLSASAMFGITVTSTPTTAWAYTGAGSFYIGSNHVYTAHGGGASGVTTTMEMVENSYFAIPESSSYDIAWSGTVLFKGFMSYKYTFAGDGSIKIYAKSTLLQNAEYELIAQGKATGMDTTKTYYISLMAANTFKLNKLVFNGNSDVSTFGLNKAVIS